MTKPTHNWCIALINLGWLPDNDPRTEARDGVVQNFSGCFKKKSRNTQAHQFGAVPALQSPKIQFIQMSKWVRSARLELEVSSEK